MLDFADLRRRMVDNQIRTADVTLSTGLGRHRGFAARTLPAGSREAFRL